MKGLLLDNGVLQFRSDLPVPHAPEGEVLIRVLRAGICNTDLELCNGYYPFEGVLGHEFVGVVAVGPQTWVGQRVVGEINAPCGVCAVCEAGRRLHCPERTVLGIVGRNGAFAEYVVIPATNVFRPSVYLPTDLLSIFDPYGNAVHTALSFNMVGEDVIITGAGPIGIMAAMVAGHCGARNVILTDVNEYRLDLAKRIVPKVQPINVAKQEITRNFMESLGILEGFDVCLEMSGSPAAFRDVLSKMINGGNIAMLGIMPDDTGIPWTDVVFKGLNIKGIYGREMYETWYKMVMMIQSGLPIERVITHRFHYTEFQQGFDIMRSGQSGKVILDWKD